MHSIWPDMFVLNLPLLEKVLRPLIVYAFLIIGLRLAGKRELAQLNPFDLVVLLILSNTVQNAIIGDDNSVTGGLVGAATLLLVNYAVIRFLFVHDRLDRIVEGEADVLIEGGRIKEKNMKRELLTKTELETAVHKQGFSDLGDVERAVIEPGGAIYFAGKKPSSEEMQQPGVSDRLDAITEQLKQIQAMLQSPRQAS